MADQHMVFMREAIRLSHKGMDNNEGGPFGSIIVLKNEIVGRGNNKVSSTMDPTAHAEITAIRDACKRLNTFQLGQCEIYSSCEPCPMCLGAIYWAKIKAIYFACSRTDAAAIGFSDEFIYHEIPKQHHQCAIPITQLNKEEAMEVFREWLKKPDKIVY